jgi:hypothetical protein
MADSSRSVPCHYDQQYNKIHLPNARYTIQYCLDYLDRNSDSQILALPYIPRPNHTLPPREAETLQYPGSKRASVVAGCVG